MNQRDNILNLVRTKQPIRVVDLVRLTGLSNAMVHRHLRNLETNNFVERFGTPPKVFYGAPAILTAADGWEEPLLENNWLTITGRGELVFGSKGFEHWCAHEKRGFNPLDMFGSFEEIYKKYEKLRTLDGYLDIPVNRSDLGMDSQLEYLMYGDVFAYEIFGKTKWGQLVWQAKLTEDLHLMKMVCAWIRPIINSVIKKYQIDAVAYVPHSLPRKRPFLPFLEAFLHLDLFHIDLYKAQYHIPLAQKTLKTKQERIENATNTLFVSDVNWPVLARRVLLIDDAVGSGATLEIMAKKIKESNREVEVFGLALVGSIKGFEVLNEI